MITTLLILACTEYDVNKKPEPDEPYNPVVETGYIPQNDSVDTQDTAVEDTAPPLGQPIAVCSVDPANIDAIYGSADWIGNTSYDTAGYAITDYNWTLYSAPAGNLVDMPAGSANRRSFMPDLAGEYVGQLIVTNEIGQVSEPCYATLNALAGDGLWIEMFWTNSGDDMDLHLVEPRGTIADYFTDCYYANCTSGLEWGSAGPSDNPILDLDDIPGTGPENINIDSPYAGIYTVYVHDYPGSVYNGRNDVTVNIYVGGILEWTDTSNINSEGLYEPICEINWRGSATTVTGI